MQNRPVVGCYLQAHLCRLQAQHADGHAHRVPTAPTATLLQAQGRHSRVIPGAGHSQLHAGNSSCSALLKAVLVKEPTAVTAAGPTAPSPHSSGKSLGTNGRGMFFPNVCCGSDNRWGCLKAAEQEQPLFSCYCHAVFVGCPHSELGRENSQSKTQSGGIKPKITASAPGLCLQPGPSKGLCCNRSQSSGTAWWWRCLPSTTVIGLKPG